MKQNTNTLAMKARLANYIRKTFYKKKWEDLKVGERDQILLEIFSRNLQMHWELNAYKQKRKDKAALHQKRLQSPLTKSMKKKLGLIKKTPKINLESPK